jgi:leucyl aminopeptidase
VEGIILSMYRFDRYKSERKEQKLKHVTLLVRDESALGKVEESIEEAGRICRGAYTARDLTNMPSVDCYPEKFAEIVYEVGRKAGFNVRIYRINELERMSMGGIVAVGSGSIHKPVLIELEYDGTGGRDGSPYVIVGKAVTFDSGGISIKPSEKMEEMKYDKAGGAAVVGVLEAVASLKLPIKVVGLIPCVENLPSGTAFRPGDIIKFRNGKTAEIISTDAEGRLILADALSYAVEKNPKAVIDLATLTGACIIALGTHASGLFTNNQELAEKIKKSAERTGERVWQLPLWKQYGEQLKSDVADLKNSGGRPAGAITAALFLSEFVGDKPWVHLDIAGTAYMQEASEQKSYTPRGATGVGVRLIVDYLIHEAQ